MKIVMLEPIGVSEELLNQLSKGFRDKNHKMLFCLAPLSEQEKLKRAQDADVLIVANTPLSDEFIGKLPKVKMISVAFTGVDHIPKAVCQNRKIVVSNAQGYATAAVTELVYGLIIACLRNITLCDAAARNGLTKEGLVGSELSGKTIGIIGYGAIGQSVSAVAKAFGCSVLAYSKRTGDALVKFCSLEELLSQSDIVSLHVPLTETTKGMINKEKLALMKSSAILINTSRGGVVDAKALAEALNAGAIAGAGIDVFDSEPPLPANEPLLKAKNIVLTPHIGFASKESMVKRAVITFDNISAWMNGKPVNVKI